MREAPLLIDVVGHPLPGHVAGEHRRRRRGCGALALALAVYTGVGLLPFVAWADESAAILPDAIDAFALTGETLVAAGLGTAALVALGMQQRGDESISNGWIDFGFLAGVVNLVGGGIVAGIGGSRVSEGGIGPARAAR